MSSKGRERKQLELIRLMEEQLWHERRTRLLPFTKATFPRYEANWHHQRLADSMDQLISGEIWRLLVTMPPRHGKSELFSRRTPALALGKNPDEKIMSCSYADDLASRMARDVKRIMDSREYATLFPRTRLIGRQLPPDMRIPRRGEYADQSDFFETVGHTGSYRSAGIGGGITGMGFTLGLVDDPIKNLKEALSASIREAQWEWYTTAFLTRMEEDARIGMTLTRWHEDDMAGRQLELVKTGVLSIDWHVLDLPAIRETGVPDETDPRTIGEVLWPKKFGLTFMNDQKISLGSARFAALYQQRPAPAEGGAVKRAWFKRYRELPPDCNYMISADLSVDDDGPDNSYAVFQVWAWRGADIFLVHQVRRRMDFPAQLAVFRELSETYRQATMKLVEKKANGSPLIKTVKSDIQGVIGVNPRGSKAERLAACAPLIECGNVYLPEFSEAPWIADFVEEVVTFPNAPHDDQVDAMTQALNRLRGETAPAIAPGGVERASMLPK